MKQERRLFTKREKIRLYIGAGGRCQGCGTRLERGWHADHHVPYSKGGATALTNGRAKCRTCNLRDGNRMPYQEGRK